MSPLPPSFSQTSVTRRPYGVHRAIPYGIFLIILTSIVAYLYSEFPELDTTRPIAGNLGFFLFINVNIIVVMVLVFLAGKNIFTLVLDRRRNILGSRLRARLAAAFLGLSLVPTILLFLIAKGILETVLQEWFSPQVVTALEGARGVAQSHYDVMTSIVTRNTKTIARRLVESPRFEQLSGEDGHISSENAESIRKILSEKREEYGLTGVTLIDRAGRELVSVSGGPGDERIRPFHLSETGMEEAKKGRVFVLPESSPEGEFLRGYAPVLKGSGSGETSRVGSQTPTRYVVVTDLRILPVLAENLALAVTSFDEYQELRSVRRPLASSYLLTLIVVTLLIVFSSVWVGFYLAKGLSVPIGLLAHATSEVAQGNLDLQIPEVGDDELTILVRSFNTMTTDLKQTTGELVQRRRYMETVFESLEIGVVSMDTRFRIMTMNKAAAKILGADSPGFGVGRPIGEVLHSDLSNKVAELGEELFQGSDRIREATVTITSASQSKYLQLALSKLTDDQEGSLGAVLLLDDISELVSAQRMAAWREVARRIAHEIKNPLTPIQLNAERLQRKFRSRESEIEAGVDPKAVLVSLKDDFRLVGEATETIVKQVDNLRTLVNEFSRFARMPKSQLQPADVNVVIDDSVAIYRGAHADVEFVSELGANLPKVAIDREQMMRVMVNLIDNALASVQEGKTGGVGDIPPKIVVRSKLESDLGLVTVQVSDNGKGIPRGDLPRLFEPYFSTKKAGTGLGLAIVSAIIADHNGFIRAKNNEPRGASFTIELPLLR